MKRLFLTLLPVIMAFSLAACGSSAAGEQMPSTPPASSQPTEQSESAATGAPEQTLPESGEQYQVLPEEEPATEEAASLIVYFSWSGNTEAVANEIQTQTGADIFEIVPAEPYTDDYDALLDIAQDEQSNNARPEIGGVIDGFDDYDTVYVGFPNWWGDMPMILYTFFDSYDLSGKTVVPFVTSGGSGFSGTISTMESLEPDANFLDGLSLGSSEAKNPVDAVSQWLDDIGIDK